MSRPPPFSVTVRVSRELSILSTSTRKKTKSNAMETTMTTFRVSLFLVTVLFLALIVALMRSLMSKQMQRKLAKTTRRDDVKSAEMLLKKIWIYPLKSGKRVEVKEVEIRPDGCGLMYDRMFMVVDKIGEMVSQRKVRAMARIETTIDKKAGVARLSAPGMNQDLELNLKRTNETKSIETEIWRVNVSGLDCGSEASDWITSYLDPKGTKKKSPVLQTEEEATTGAR